MTTTSPETTTGHHGLLLPDDVQQLLFTQARTANAFTDEPVTPEQVRAVYDLVKFGPTALNGQPLRIVLIRTDDAKERLLKHVADGNRDKTESAPLTAVLAADVDFHERLPEVFPHAPHLRDAFEANPNREDVARFNAALQIGYFIVGVRAAGLAAGPMAGFDAAGLDEDLFAGTSLRSMLLVNIGHPAENAWQERLPRLDVDDAVIAA